MRRLLLLTALLHPLAAADLPRLRDDDTWRHALEAALAEPVPAAPDAAVAHAWRLSMVAFDARRYDEGEAQMRRALAVAPAVPGLHSNLSVMLGKQGRFAEAATAARAALALDPTYLHAKLVLPSWELGLGQREAALAAFSAIPVPDDGQERGLYHAATACFFADAGDAKRVAQGIRDALAADPEQEVMTFFRRDVVFDRYRAEPWFVDLVGATLDAAY